MPTDTSDQPDLTSKSGSINRIGLTLADYKGATSTLCAGCGHDAITSSIVKALHELGLEPHRIAKLSGIGCSSKTPNYFLDHSHGFNSLHGRMATIATGASLANHTLTNIGVSGDGDTASIGLGNFLHMVRRNVPMVYIVENNGCYGLTKGQFSATADKGSVKRGGKGVNTMTSVDICALAIQMGCHFVARSFSGDTQQVKTLLKAALSHNGTAVLDIISPCVAFNNHEGSTKSVTYARKHEDPLHAMDFIPSFEPITVEYDAGTTKKVRMHDGSIFTLKKLGHDYEANDKDQAMALLHEAQDHLHFYTGLLYYEEDSHPFDEEINLVEEPLATLPQERVRPSEAVFAEIMESFK
ncbi:MAG: 2-oxoacid:ferredoxin oxidoreductase subunit beta [Candidatus Hydrogenedentes bacterium]|nr:2-oxoacid:ferredoxin oxidoreductase subunit beta [Candidatus Hydrogenedentota bacterium]